MKIVESGGQLLFANNSNNRLSGVTVTGDLNLNSINNSRVRLQNGANFTGDANVGYGGDLIIEDNLTLDNTTINLNGYDAGLGVSGTNTLTIGENATVNLNERYAHISSDQYFGGTGTVINQGTITADGTVQRGTYRYINPDIFINQGIVEAVNGGSLQINSANWNNTDGTFRVDGTSTLSLQGNFTDLGTIDNTANGTVYLEGTLDNNDDVLVIDETANKLTLNGGVITGGEIVESGGQLLFANNSNNRLSGVTVTGDLNLNSINNSRVRLQNGANFTGDANVGYGGDLIIEDNLTLDNTTINLNGYDAGLGVSGTNTLTIGENATVNLNERYAHISSDQYFGGTGTVINQGTITADGTVQGGTYRYINPDVFINQGVVEAINGATLNLDQGWSNAAGTLRVDGTSTLNLQGNFTDLGIIDNTANGTVNLQGTLDNNDDVLVIDETANKLTLNGGVITGGEIVESGGQLLFSSNNQNRLSGATITGDLNLNSVSNSRVRLQNGANFTGDANVGYGSDLIIEDNLTLDNKTINLNGYDAGLGVSGTNTLTIGENATVSLNERYAHISSDQYFGGTGTVINQGTITADGTVQGGAYRYINPDIFINQGIVEAVNGAQLRIDSTPINFSAGTLTGGTYSVGDNSTIRLNGVNITENAATISIEGVNANLFNATSGSTNALANLSTNTAVGNLTIGGGYDFTTANSLNNFGVLTVGSDSTLTVRGDYIQIDGSTILEGGTLTSTTGIFDLRDGTLSGSGNLIADATIAGAIAADLNAGIIDIDGDYTQLDAAELNIELGGTAVDNFDQIDIAGAASFDGFLNISLIDGFAPLVGDTFEVLRYSSFSGDFDAINGLELEGGLTLKPVFLDDRLVLTVNGPVNNAPLATDDSYSLDEDAILSVDDANGLLANDVDPDNDFLTAVLVDAPENGTLNLNDDGSFSYAPNSNFNGSDSFTYRASDSATTSELKTVTLTVNSIDDKPVAVDDNYSVEEDSTLSVNVVDGVLTNDSDVEDSSLTLSLVNDVKSGTLVLKPNGSFTYNPNTDFNGSDSFTYQVSDSNGNTQTATVTLTVNSINDNPFAVNDSYSVDEDNTLVVDGVAGILANDSDVESATLTIQLLSDVSNGSLTLNDDGSFEYIPSPNFSGTDSFTYSIDDGNGGVETATATITVNEIADDAPTQIQLSNTSIDENVANGSVVGTLGTIDPDAGDTHTYELVNNADGRFAIVGNEIQVTNSNLLDAETNTSHDLIIRSTDAGGLSIEQTFTITVNNVNEAPNQIQLSNASIDEQTTNGTVIGTLATTDSDVEDTHTYSLVDNAEGRFTIVNGNQIAIADSSKIDFESNSTHTIIVRTTDAGGLTYDQSLTISINDLPEPDLTIDAVNAPSTASFGETFNVSWTVNNNGDGITTSSWKDKVYLSTDDTLSDDDLELSTTTINNSVGANGQYEQTASVTLPLSNTVVDGSYYILVKTDADTNQTELDENNNVAKSAIALTVPPTPDLVVSNIVAPTEAFSGQDIEVTWTITNNGDANATGTWTDTIYLSNDAEVGADQQYGSFSFTGTIEVGQSIERKQVITLPIDLNDTRHIIVKTDANNQLFEYTSEDNNATVKENAIAVELSPFPNLQVESVIAPDTAFSSQKTVVEWIVTNNGTGATSTPVWSDGVWLSFDQVYDRTDVYLGQVNNPNYLDVGESYRNSLEVTLPQGIDSNYYFLVKTDVSNRVLELGNEGDNFNYGGPTDVSLTPAPDLQVDAVNAPSFAFSGQSLPVSWTITNTGLGQTLENSWTDSIYLSTDTVWDENDKYLGQQYHQGFLGVDESYSATKNVSLPIGISGDYYFIVRTDTGKQVYESIAEFNNDGLDDSPTSVSLTPPPDLEVEYVNAPTTALASQALTLNYLVTNYGATPTPNSTWTDAFYLSTDDRLDTNTDIRLGTYRHRGFLDSGASYEQEVTFNLPNGIEGDYQIFVVSDSSNEVFELNNDNNTFRSSNRITVASFPADLVVTEINANLTAEAGKATLLNWTVTNQGIGNTATDNWIDYVWLSVDDVVGNDTLLGSFVHNGLLDVNESYSRSELVTLPFNVEGNNRLYVTTDTSKKVYEAENETNNTSELLLVDIIQQAADLQVTSIGAPIVAASGESFTVNWTVSNQGAGKTNSNYWYDEVFLSKDTNLNYDSDISLGKVYHSGSLNDSGSYDASGTFELPQDIEGNYYVLINTDKFNKVFEGTSEDNNVTATTAATVISLSDTPDLVLESIDAPNEGISGQSVEVTWTVSNQGAATNGRWRDVFYLSRDQVFDRNSDTYLGFVEHRDGLAAGETYTETTYLNLPAGTSGPFYIYAVTDSSDRLYERNGENNNYTYDPQAVEVSLPPPADLVAGTITIPVNGVPGQDATIEYTVENQGDFPAEGSWTDSIYLSADGQWDINDLLFAQVQVSDSVNTGDSYTKTVTAPLPGVVPGDYQVIIRSDVRNTIVEADDANNLGASLEQFTLDVESLELGVAETGEFATGQSVYYRIDVPAGETLLLSLDNQSVTAANELYISYGKMPSRSNFDFGYDRGISPDQEIVVPKTKAGTYYVLAYGNAADSGVGYSPNFNLKAELLDFSLRGISTQKGSNRGQVTLTLNGAEFTTNTEAQLVAADGTVVTASNIIWKDSTELWATFDLQGSEIGQYDVQILDGAETDLLADSFTVTNGPVGNLDLQINAPSAVRPGQPGIVTINYTNTGETDLIAPLLEISSQNAQLRLASESQFTGTSGLTLLGINTDGPGGILIPGATGTMSFVFAPTGNDTIRHNVRPVSYEEYNWDEAKDFFKPAYISQAAWDKIWANFTAEVGNDTADYQALLSSNATYLSQLGEYTPDISRLVEFELKQASNYLSLSQRYHLSSFGRGGSFLGDIRAVVSESGNVTIQNNGQYRFFELQSDGTFQGYTGDYATLVRDGVTYSLQETNGTVTAFGADGRLDYIEDTNGIRTTANYTEGQFTGFSDSQGGSLTFAYNDQGRITSATDQDGRTTNYAYDETGEYLLGVTDESDSVNYTYSDNGEITSITDANGVQVLYKYDDNGRVISQQVAGSNQTVSYSYGSAGEVTITDANGATTELLLDERGRVSRQEDALGRLTQFQYDSQGNLIGVNAPENFSVAYSYDERGNLVGQINPLGDEVKFTYEPNYEWLQTVTDARGNDLGYSYDERGNLTATTYEDGSSENFTVDGQGNTVESVNRRGIAIGYEYNTRGQVTRVDYQDGSADTYTYDNAGRLTATNDASGTTSIEYDANNPNLMAKITYPTGRSLAYTYDVGGRRTQMVDQDSSEVNYRYDAAGRLAGLTDETGSSIVSYSYDDVGRLAREDNGNGTYTTYTYDLVGQLLNLANYATDDSLNSSYVYTYDDLGRQISATDLDGEWVYEYDAASQLTGAVFTSTNPEIDSQDLSYEYDAAGNRIRTINNGVTTEYQTNDLNQYTNAGTVDYQYDLDGNLTYKSDGVNSWTYSYDDQNRLLNVLEADGSQTEYEYDIFGKRIATVYNGERTEYLVDPFGYGDVIGEYDGNGNLTAEYTHGIGLVSRTDSSNVAAYYDFNVTGSAVGLTGAGGEVLNRYGYLPYGESLFESESIDNSFEFVGQWGITEEANGLDFMRARYYMPSEGRFLNTDPIGLFGGLNFYAYTENNPITRIDPIGLSYTSVVFISGDVLGGIVRGTENQGIIIGDSISGTINVGGSLTSSIFGNLQVNQDYTRYQGGIFDLAIVVNIPKNFKEAQVTFEAGLAVDANGNPIGAGFNASEITYVGVPIPNVIPEDAEIVVDDDGNINIDLDGDGGPGGGASAETTVVRPSDPNDIVGPDGFGDENWVAAKETLPYTIRFENQATATAPAQQVKITHPLDGDVDWRTFRLGSFGWDNMVFDIPENRSFYSERIDLIEERGFLVDVFAGIDPSTGEAFWTITAIDPETGEAPEDPLIGFLPPNNENGVGDGFVTYTIKPSRNAQTGDVIDAEATIIFDTEEPIDTPPIFHTIDAGKPDSTINALPKVSNTEEFTVGWTGNDDENGSAIASYTIYVSENGGEFILWLENTTLTEATYVGESGNTYSFYTVATDNVGNVQDLPTSAQASITVAGDNTPPVIVNPIDDLVATEDAFFSFILPEDAFRDIDSGDNLTYTAILEDGSELPSWLTFDADTRIFSGTPLNENVDTIRVKVTVTDSEGETATDTFELEVVNVNDAPTLEDAIANQVATEDEAFSFTLAEDTFADVDAGDSLTYSATLADGSSLPGWLSFDAETSTFSGTPVNENIGTLNVKVIAKDNDGETATDTFELEVVNVNDAPTVKTAIANQTAIEDSGFSFTFPENTFKDVDIRDVLTYTANLADGSELPSWLSFNAETRTFNGTPVNENVGTLSIKITATDNDGESVSNTFDLEAININDTPTIENALVNQIATEDEAFSFTLAENTFNDVDAGDSLTYSANLADGDELPSWLTFNADTRTFSGTPVNDNVGTLSVLVTATDNDGESASSTFELEVANVNNAPTIESTIANQTATEDEAFSFTFNENTFNDVDTGDSLTYTANLADGSELPSWLTFDAETRTFNGTPINDDVGTISLLVTATDNDGEFVSNTFELEVINVNDAPTLNTVIANQVATEDEAFSFTLAEDTFNDVDTGDSLTYTANLADGSELPSWLTFDAETRTFNGTPVNENVGNQTIKVTATDNNGETASDTFELEVANVNDAPTVKSALANQTATQDIEFSFTFSESTFNDVDTGDSLTYSATLIDGSALPDWLTFNPARRTFSGTPVNKYVGTLSIQVTATDNDGEVVSDTFELEVINVNDAPILENAIANQIAIEDEAFSFTFNETTFKDVDGDVLTYTATLANGSELPSWLSFDAETRTFSGIPVNENVSTLSVQVTATDNNGESVEDTFELEVINVNDTPTVKTAIANQVAIEDAEFSFTFPVNTFNDVDAGDSLTYSATNADGTELPSWLSFNADTRTFSGSPLNKDVGNLSIIVTATDNDGKIANEIFELEVINVNDAPTWKTAIANQTATEDIEFIFSFSEDTFNDVDAGDSLTYSATNADGSLLPSWLSFNAETRTFSGIPVNEDVGNLSIIVTATDQSGETISNAFELMVINVNDAPTLLSALANQTATEDEAFSFTFPANTFNDVDAGDSLTYTVADANGNELPSWLTFDAETRTLIGTPVNEDVGNFSIQVTATDNNGETATDIFELEVINVNDTPLDINLSNLYIDENSSNGTIIGSLSTLDPDLGDSFSYTLLNNADGRFILNNNNLQVAAGNLLDFETNGSHQIEIQTTDTQGLSITKNFTLLLNDLNEAPITTNDRVTANSSNAKIISIESLLSNDRDPEGNPLSLVSIGNATGGTISLDGDSIVFTPNGTSDIGNLNTALAMECLHLLLL